MRSITFATYLLPCILLAAFLGCHAQNTTAASAPRRPRIREELGKLDELLSLVTAGFLTYPEIDNLIEPRNATVTVFAPTNRAMRRLLRAFKLPIFPDPGEPFAGLFLNILRNHIVPGRVLFAQDIANNATVTTLFNNSTLRFDTRAVRRSIVVRARNSDALVLTPDIRAARSVIHVIDDVLLPVNPQAPAFATVAQAATAAGLTTLVAALSRAGLAANASSPGFAATVYAPTNAAFAKYLQDNRIANLTAVPPATLRDLLLYHITPEYRTTGGMQADQRVATLLPRRNLRFVYTAQQGVQTGVTIRADRSRAGIVRPDVFAGRSVVHVIDTVLAPRA